MQPDEFETLVQHITAAPGATRLLPKPVPAQAQKRVQQPHRVVWFAAGSALWLSVAIELRVLQLLWHLHG